MPHPAPTPDVLAAIVEQIRDGAPRHVAAAVAGIAESTLAYWLAQGRASADGATLDDPCPRCGATGTSPCTTGSGKRAPAPHSGRPTLIEGRDEVLVHLVAQVERAEAEAHAESVAAIRQAGKDNWQAHAWYLERRYPEQYGRRRVELSGPDAGPIGVDLGAMGLAEGVSTERLAELAGRFDDTDT